MAVHLKKLKEQVIVITGATSGIGLATAKMAADQGARLVLSSRNESDLRELVGGICNRGGRAGYVVADVADPQQVQQIADFALREFGGFDTWVNNAGTALYGKLVDTPMDEKRRLFDVNFWGVVSGCKVALAQLRQRGGAIINLGAAVSRRALPLQAIYRASKYAVKSYTEALQMEIESDGLPVSVSLVEPTAIDTPYTEHAVNHLPESPVLAPMVYRPEIVAKAILHCAQHPRREVLVGGGAKALSLLETLVPRFTDRFKDRAMFRVQRSRQSRPGPEQVGLFHAPSREGKLRGNYRGYVRKRSFYTASVLHPLASTLFGVVVLAGLSAFLARRREVIPGRAGLAERARAA